jgi:hypothetical protein
MAKSKTSRRYTREFRQELIASHQAARSIPERHVSLVQLPGPLHCGSSRPIATARRGDGGLTTSERQELARLRHENKRQKLEREIFSASGRNRKLVRRPSPGWRVGITPIGATRVRGICHRWNSTGEPVPAIMRVLLLWGVLLPHLRQTTLR